MAMANETEVQQLIAEGSAALRHGDKSTARTLLTRALEQDDRNEQVWLWLSGAVDTPEEQRICLENVLVLNPASDIARRGLALLDQQAATPAPAPPLVAALPTPPPPAPAPPVASTAAEGPSTGPPAPEAWPPPDGSIFGSAPAVDDSILPNWMGQDGGDAPVVPPAPSAPALPSSGSIFGLAPAPPAAGQPGWMGQPAAPPPAPEAPPPQVGGAVANWANVVNSLRSTEAFQAPPAPEPEPRVPGLGAPESLPAWGTAPQDATPPPSAAWPPAGPGPAAPDPALSGIQPFQVPAEIGHAPPPAASDPFGGLFSNPPAPPGYFPPGHEAPPAYEGYGSPPAAGGDAPHTYSGGDSIYEVPASAESFQFGTSDPYMQGEYTSPDGPGLLANLAGYDVAGHNYGSSPSLIGRPPLNRTAVTPTIPCPNCGELVTESALSCPRCNYRFYAPCPNCGEYIDTGDPSPAGKDVCPRCAAPVDKLALGRAGVRVAGRGTNPREAMLAATRAQKAQKEVTGQQAPAAAKPRRRTSGAAVLLLLILLVALALLVAYQMQIEPVYGLLHSMLSTVPTVEPAP